MVNEVEVKKIETDVNTDATKAEGIFARLEQDIIAFWDEHFHSKGVAVPVAAKTALHAIVTNAVTAASGTAAPESVAPSAATGSTTTGSSDSVAGSADSLTGASS